MLRAAAVPRAAITSTRPRPLPRPLLGGRPLPRPLTLFLVAAGMASHNTPWSLTFLLNADRDGDSGDSGVGGGGVRQTSALVLLAGEHIEISEETLQVLF